MKFILLACILSTLLVEFCSTSPIPSTNEEEIVDLVKRTSRKKYVKDCPTPTPPSGGGGVYGPPKGSGDSGHGGVYGSPSGGGSISIYGSPNGKIDSDKLTKKLKKLLDAGLSLGIGASGGLGLSGGAGLSGGLGAGLSGGVGAGASAGVSGNGGVSNALGGSGGATATVTASAPMPSRTPTPAGAMLDTSNPAY